MRLGVAVLALVAVACGSDPATVDQVGDTTSAPSSATTIASAPGSTTTRLSDEPGASSTIPPSRTGTTVGRAAPGTWRTLATPPSDIGYSTAHVWTGTQLVVWGQAVGVNGSHTPVATLYDLAANKWSDLPSAPVAPRSGHVGVWTGAEVLFWGGASTPSGDAAGDGVAYNPATRAWRRLPKAPIAGTSGAEAVWTGTELIVWGGYAQCCPIDSTIHDVHAAAYDPAENSWAKIADVPKPWSGDDGNAVTISYDGGMLVWRRNRLGVYERLANRWRDLGSPQVPGDQCATTSGPVGSAVATGGLVRVWTGGCGAVHGFAFDLSAEQWRQLADAPAGGVGPVTSAGDALFASVSPPLSHLVRYAVATDGWADVTPPAPVQFVGFPDLVWTGSELLAFGRHGDADDANPPPAAVAYRPG
jgi:hypothetical protein